MRRNRRTHRELQAHDRAGEEPLAGGEDRLHAQLYRAAHDGVVHRLQYLQLRRGRGPDARGQCEGGENE